jgi:hypothetical protein
VPFTLSLSNKVVFDHMQYLFPLGHLVFLSSPRSHEEICRPLSYSVSPSPTVENNTTTSWTTFPRNLEENTYAWCPNMFSFVIVVPDD